MNDLKKYRELPKIELHAHLNGSISLATIQKLLNLNPSIKNAIPTDFVLQQPTTMEEVFKLFPLIQSLTQTQDALKMATLDVIKEFNDDGTVYLELRSTPKKTDCMSKKEYIRTILEAIRESRKKLPIVVTLILSIDRRQSVEEAQDTVMMAIEDASGYIVGVELSGDPSIDGQKFLPALAMAKKRRLGVSIHLAELPENTDEIIPFLEFKPDRIGHGTFLHTDQAYIDLMDKYRIPLEICLTSNTLCKTTATVADSHFPFWRQKGVPIAICTDDKGLMNDCTLSHEYQKAAEAFNFDFDQLRQISRDAFTISFASRKLSKKKVAMIWHKL